MDTTSKLRQIIREEIKKELILRESDAVKGGVIGYLTGALIDFLMKKKGSEVPEKSLAQLEKDMKVKLDKKYSEDPKFKQIVDDLMAGKIIVP